MEEILLLGLKDKHVCSISSFLPSVIPLSSVLRSSSHKRRLCTPHHHYSDSER
ncbi:hypothetical protein PISMIDRAFT_673983 [Pisolithus microcarpus 441]|uniref:Uncharacterized protein n=1 Tax=Pisolithus microcarpus 441 TaxID=765257 RepID=A0A0C9YTJ1_9AGAM|nr:hypothetical protein PISMIDRAFT_673983 [Pisolithus microcarpus 441]